MNNKRTEKVIENALCTKDESSEEQRRLAQVHKGPGKTSEMSNHKALKVEIRANAHEMHSFILSLLKAGMNP